MLSTWFRPPRRSCSSDIARFDERNTTMADRQSMTIEDVVRKAMAVDEHADVLRQSVRLVVHELMDGEVTELTGAAHGERNPHGRLTRRNGRRPRVAHQRRGDRWSDTMASNAS
jgi:hypothetical protein